MWTRIHCITLGNGRYPAKFGSYHRHFMCIMRPQATRYVFQMHISRDNNTWSSSSCQWFFSHTISELLRHPFWLYTYKHSLDWSYIVSYYIARWSFPIEWWTRSRLFSQWERCAGDLRLRNFDWVTKFPRRCQKHTKKKKKKIPCRKIPLPYPNCHFLSAWYHVTCA